ncbi:MAG: hypothetical protein M3256_15245, partial [Actinomycetota bacterium]|nr:hypothetical protein [Actinomycetota bacterium]
AAGVAVVVVALVSVLGALAARRLAPRPVPGAPAIQDLKLRAVSRPGTVERVAFTADGATAALLTFRLDDSVYAGRWEVRLSRAGAEISRMPVTIKQGEGHVLVPLPVDGSYDLIVSGDGSVAYDVAAKGAMLLPPQGGAFEASVSRPEMVNLHPMSVKDIAVITVKSSGELNSVQVLDSNGAFQGGPDFEESGQSRTVVTSGEYLLAVGLGGPGRYSVRVETPHVEELVGGQTKTFTIDAPGELDFYRFKTQPGQVALFRMTSGQFEPKLTVFTPDGIAAAATSLAGDEHGPTSAVAFAVKDEREHFLVAGAAADDSPGNRTQPPMTGSYDLSYTTAAFR